MTSDSLLELLNGLGQASEDVAERLLTAACQGRRDDFRSCPVAVYMQCHGLHDVEVGNEVVFWEDEQGYRQSLPTPHPVAEFILDFDGGKYPQLQRQP